MHIDSFEEVTKLLTIIKKLEKAFVQSFSFMDKSDLKGYYMNISKHSDGSGKCIDLSGCMIANEVIIAVQKEIENKYDSVINELESLGVDCSGMTLYKLGQE